MGRVSSLYYAVIWQEPFREFNMSDKDDKPVRTGFMANFVPYRRTENLTIRNWPPSWFSARINNTRGGFTWRGLFRLPWNYVCLYGPHIHLSNQSSDLGASHNYPQLDPYIKSVIDLVIAENRTEVRAAVN